MKAGYGVWEQPPQGNPTGGRPTRVFRLSTLSTVYETPKNPDDFEGFVDVDALDGADKQPSAGDDPPQRRYRADPLRGWFDHRREDAR